MHSLLTPRPPQPLEKVVKDLYSQTSIKLVDARGYGLGFLIEHPSELHHYAELVYLPYQQKFAVKITGATYDVYSYAKFVEHHVSELFAWAADLNNALYNPDHATSSEPL